MTVQPRRASVPLLRSRLRGVLTLSAGWVFGIGCGYWLFSADSRTERASTPQPSTLEVKAIEATKAPAVRDGTTNVPSSEVGASAQRVNTESEKQSARSDVEALRAELEHERATQQEGRGTQPVDPPTGLPARFSDQQSLLALWRERLKAAGFLQVDPVIRCEEYPCYVLLDGIGIDDFPALDSQLLPPPFRTDRRVPIFSSEPADGGMRWRTAIGLIPSEEPRARVAAVSARLIARSTQAASKSAR